MPRKLSQEEVVTLKTLKARSQSNCQIARVLGITEGAVRYRLRRDGQPDGRRNKPRKADEVAAAIEHWIEDQQARGASRPVNVMLLFEWLRGEHGYRDSYRSVLRLVRAKYPRPKVRPLHRVETPPGAQAQADWSEFSEMDVGDGPQKLHAFVMVLSHSRKEAVIWSPQVDQLAWHHVHNEALRRWAAFQRSCGLTTLRQASRRAPGRGVRSIKRIERTPEAWAFTWTPVCLIVRKTRGRLRARCGSCGTSICMDDASIRWRIFSPGRTGTWRHSDCDRICPATGLSVEASWRMEQRYLRPLGILPEVFDLAVTRSVYKDCTVSFEGRTYSVPFTLCRLLVEVRGCAEVVQILHDGRVVAEHPRHSRKRLQIDPAHYEGPGDDRVDPPVPLGRMGRRLTEIVMQPVEERPLDLYAALMEVAR